MAYPVAVRTATGSSTLSLSGAPESLTVATVYDRRGALTERAYRTQAVVAGLAAAAVIVAIFAGSTVWRSPAWEVTGLPGTPRLRTGQVLETDSSSTAQVKVANIGQITVDPNTRIRLLVTRSDEHRHPLAGQRGPIVHRASSAAIVHPSVLFCDSVI